VTLPRSQLSWYISQVNDATNEQTAEQEFIYQQVMLAVQPFVEILSNDDFMWLKERLTEQLMADPTLHDLIDSARPRQVDISGERPKNWLLDDDEGGADAKLLGKG
jgi:hypothetical protein